MPTPAIHIMGGSLAYLLVGDLSINRIGIVVGIVLLSCVHDLDFLFPGPHRGITHSLLFCLAMTATVPWFTPFAPHTVFLITMSHLLLDSVGDGFSSVWWTWPFGECKACVPTELTDLKGIIKHAFRIF